MDTRPADGDWFHSVNLFKRNPACGGRARFVAYEQGKAAVRLAPGVVPSGSHRFASQPPARALLSRVATKFAAPHGGHDDGGCVAASGLGEPLVVRSSCGDGHEDACLLHFVNCDFKEWKVKYEALGTFGDAYCGADPETDPIPFAFHLVSRDLLARPDMGDDAEHEVALRAAYNSAMVHTPDAVAAGLARGDLVRLNGAVQAVLVGGHILPAGEVDGGVRIGDIYISDDDDCYCADGRAAERA